jgi:hypothetical protein
MRAQIDREAVNRVLHGEVLKLPIMVRIVLMENGDGSAVARGIDAIKSGIKTDYIWIIGHWQKRNWLVLIKIKDGHQVVAFAREKNAMVLGIDCHAVISFAASYRIPPNHLVHYWINDRKNVSILQVDVCLAAIGTPEYNILAWHWTDIGAEITKKLPHEPTFKSADFMAKVSALPLFVIASPSNEYITPDVTRALFSAARQPKRLVMIDAWDHKYSGNTEGFFRVLREGLNWIQQQHR